MSHIDDSEARRKGRERADRLQAEYLEKGGDFTGWFEELYASAQGDAALVPWAGLEPHPALVEWMRRQPPPPKGTRAIDVGCGLGDNAAFLAKCGYETTAIDISPSAIEWAKKRHGEVADFRVADLFDLPEELRGAFDLVHEAYTIQSLPIEMRARVMAAIASLVAPGGRLLVITRARQDDTVAEGPPWPLSVAELAEFSRLGLKCSDFEEFIEEREDGRRIPHFLVVYEDPCQTSVRKGLLTTGGEKIDETRP